MIAKETFDRLVDIGRCRDVYVSPHDGALVRAGLAETVPPVRHGRMTIRLTQAGRDLIREQEHRDAVAILRANPCARAWADAGRLVDADDDAFDASPVYHDGPEADVEPIDIFGGLPLPPGWGCVSPRGAFIQSMDLPGSYIA